MTLSRHKFQVPMQMVRSQPAQRLLLSDLENDPDSSAPGLAGGLSLPELRRMSNRVQPYNNKQHTVMVKLRVARDGC
jgi:hypothetical protein